MNPKILEDPQEFKKESMKMNFPALEIMGIKEQFVDAMTEFIFQPEIKKAIEKKIKYRLHYLKQKSKKATNIKPSHQELEDFFNEK